MKLKYFLISSLAVMMLAVACNDDVADVNIDNETPAAKGRVTFSVTNSSKGSVHYPTTRAIATDEENNIDTLDVYVFGIDKTKKDEVSYILETVYRGFDNMNASDNGDGTKQVTLNVSEGTKYFYFVSNGRNQRALDEVVLNKTTKDEFRTKITNRLDAPLTCPLLMTDTCEYKVAENGDITVNGTAYDPKKEAVAITLKRRMARFDVKNDKFGSQFILKKITLTGVPERNSLFDGIDFGSDTTFRTEALPSIDFAERENANVGETPSVFYMYPVNATQANNVRLVLEGTNLDNSTPQVYNLDLKKTQDAVDFMSIESNYRYVLNIKSVDAKKLSAVLTVEDWITGDTVKVNTDLGSIVLSVPTKSEDGLTDVNKFGWSWTFTNTNGDKNVIEMPADAVANDSLTIAVAAESEWKIKADSLYDWIGLSEVEAGLQKQFKITTLKPNPSKDSIREATVLVYNSYEPSINQPLVIRQAKNATNNIKLTSPLLAGDSLYISGSGATDELIAVTLTGASTWTVDKRAACTWISKCEKDGDNIKMTVDANDSYTEGRIDTITVKATYTITPTSGDKQAADQTLERRLIVRQAKKSLGIIELSLRGDVELPADAQDLTVSVKATSDWTAKVSGDGAISIEGDNQGAANGTVKLKIAANTGNTGLKDTLLVQNDKNSNIFQKVAFRQAPVKAKLSPSEILVEKDGTITAGNVINVTDMETGHEDDWELVDVPDWIEAKYTSADQKITFTGKQNDQAKPRTATLIFRHKDYPTTTQLLITVKQAVE